MGFFLYKLVLWGIALFVVKCKSTNPANPLTANQFSWEHKIRVIFGSFFWKWLNFETRLSI